MAEVNSKPSTFDLRNYLPALQNLPIIDSVYWVILLSACSMGETGADLLSHGLKLGYIWSSALLGLIFIGAILFEFKGSGHRVGRYWTAIIATATVGTTLADLTSRTLSIGYLWSSVLMIVLFANIFGTWRRKAAKGESDAHLANTSELHYWAAILVISVMGTTLGDFLSNDTPLGFGYTALVLIGILGFVFLLLRKTSIPKEPLYWFAIILTSTFGAASGDYLTKEEGMNMGPFVGTAVLAVLLVVVILAGSQVQKLRTAP